MARTGRPELGEVSEGTELLVIPVTYSRGATPEPVPVRVTKAARVWLTMEPTNGQKWPSEYRMRRDTQDDGNDSHYRNRFVTAEQYAYDRREAEAAEFLKDQGIEIGFRSPWRNRRSELADLIRPAREAP